MGGEGLGARDQATRISQRNALVVQLQTPTCCLLPVASRLLPPTDSMTDWTDQTAPSLDDFARLAREAFDALPEPFRSLAGDVVIRVDDFADEETLTLMET